jgi:hypothetical protein
MKNLLFITLCVLLSVGYAADSCPCELDEECCVAAVCIEKEDLPGKECPTNTTTTSPTTTSTPGSSTPGSSTTGSEGSSTAGSSTTGSSTTGSSTTGSEGSSTTAITKTPVVTVINGTVSTITGMTQEECDALIAEALSFSMSAEESDSPSDSVDVSFSISISFDSAEIDDVNATLLIEQFLAFCELDCDLEYVGLVAEVVIADLPDPPICDCELIECKTEQQFGEAHRFATGNRFVFIMIMMLSCLLVFS